MAYKAGLAVRKLARYKEFSIFNKCLLYLGSKPLVTISNSVLWGVSSIQSTIL